MRGLRIIAAAVGISLLCACGKEIKNYRIYDDLIVSFTEALGERTLKDENIIKTEDGRIITGAQYTYASKQADEDKENYLYYMLNNYGAAFVGEDMVAIDSRDEGYAIIIKTSSDGDTFTIDLSRMEL